MEILTQRILKKHCAAFEGADVCMHIPHRYSKESSKKSEIVNLGVLKENPASCRGVIEIMKFLKQYVPLDRNATPVPVVCNGDQLCVERMVTGRLAMAVSEEAEDQLVGLVPRPQGFHKRSVAGWLPQRLQEELTWNSTASLSGCPGNNLALDLVNEFQNNEFKYMSIFCAIQTLEMPCDEVAAH
ncbi:unnamed protein product [Mytilus coruscus]|uniref:Uncharacterized protein n=1 Tax=Mytilus coruscus TaxID=42192 RepID=A0A6J8E4E2_MYTCO|nr:unnamed protein product [Mytilus coruscus]